MANIRVDLVGTNNHDCSVTLLVEGKRIEYFIGDRFHTHMRQIRRWLDSGWTNYLLSNCNSWANQIVIVDDGHIHVRKKAMTTSIDHSKNPSKEYSFGVIAPTAKNGTIYNGERLWFKTPDDAKAFAAEIFEGADKKNFDLCIIECLDIVSVKPTIELNSRWKNTASE